MLEWLLHLQGSYSAVPVRTANIDSCYGGPNALPRHAFTYGLRNSLCNIASGNILE